MRIKILRSTIADGEFVAAGTEQEVSEASARILINLNKAEPVEAKKTKTDKVKKDAD